MPLQTGQLLYHDRYRIVKLLGQGGFGAVYRAWDTNFDRPVALKENLDTSPETQRQFKQEAQILYDLNHPNLPKVIDHFMIIGQGQYLVMEFVSGENLQEKLETNGAPLSENRVLPWIEQICDALTYLHSQEPPIIHRDIKPENIKITTQGKAMLVDFGIAKVFDPVLRTTVGARAVTPGYSPHEQYGQGKTDARSDIYALGATLFTLLTGQVPVESIQRVIDDPLLRPNQINPAISESIAGAIQQAMQLDPALRFQNTAQLKNALSAEPTRISTPLSISQPISGSTTSQPTPSLTTVIRSKPKKWIIWVSIPLFLAIMLALLFSVIGGPGRLTTLLGRPEFSSHPIDITKFASDGMSLVYIPAGAFEMGSETGFSAEKPVHTVYLEAFWIDQTEVTVAQFQKFVQEEGYFRNGCGAGDDYPVACVTWYDAQAYCQWAGRRLPTEAEWEKAARGDLVGKKYPWGDEAPVCDRNAWNGAQYDACDGDAMPVMSFKPKGYGLYDMAGNLWEWVSSLSKPYPYDATDGRENWTSSDPRLLRGGSWDSYDYRLGVADRNYSQPPNWGSSTVGFRCAFSGSQ
jgi:formylglycine-generating enzyme required for sulfatase activity/predicted Ser/Thr protein kinase